MREICQRGERLYLDGVWGGSRGPGLRVIGRGAYLPLKHQQVALSPWAGKASVSGREGGKVLSRVISQICWVGGGWFSGVQRSRAAEPLVPPGGGLRCCSRRRERRRVGSAAELTAAAGASIPPGPIIWVPRAWPPLSAAQQ